MVEDSLRNKILGDLYHDYRNFTLRNPKISVGTRDTKTIRRVIFHCTDAPGWTPERLSRFFIDERGFSICSYHYYVQAEKVYHMVGDSIVTPHAAPYNTSSIAFSIDYYASSYEKLKIPLDQRVYQNAIKTATYLCLLFQIIPNRDSLRGHRELPDTGFFWNKEQDIKILRKTCPGMAIDLDKFRYEVARSMQETMNKIAIKQLAVDGVFGPKSQAVMAALPALLTPSYTDPINTGFHQSDK